MRAAIYTRKGPAAEVLRVEERPLPEPGPVHHNGFEVTWFGKYAGLSDELLERSADIWRSSGFTRATRLTMISSLPSSSLRRSTLGRVPSLRICSTRARGAW